MHNTDCEFYFIARKFFSINFIFFSICFYFALNILTTPYRIASWNATRIYLVQSWHDMKASFFVRSENYTQVCDQDFHKAGKVSYHKGVSINIHLRHIKEKPFFFLSTLKIAFWIRHRWIFNLWMNTMKAFLQTIIAIFSTFQKG